MNRTSPSLQTLPLVPLPGGVALPDMVLTIALESAAAHFDEFDFGRFRRVAVHRFLLFFALGGRCLPQGAGPQSSR